VIVDVVATEGGRDVMKNLQRKARQADVMFSELVSHMNDSLSISRAETFSLEEERPIWL